MKLGAASWGFRETPLERQLSITKTLGLSSLEIGIAGHENDRLQVDAPAAEIAAVRDLFRQYHVELVAASTGNDFTSAGLETCRRELDKIRRVITVAAQLGVNYLRIFAGFSPVQDVTGARWNRMVECLSQADCFARAHNVKLAVETHGGVEGFGAGVRHFHSTSSDFGKLTAFLDELPVPLGIVFDPANLGAVGYSTDEILTQYEALKDCIQYMHLKDFKTLADGSLQPCACGEGKLDWGRLAQAFGTFDGYGFIEYELTEDIEDGLRRSRDVLDACHAAEAHRNVCAAD